MYQSLILSFISGGNLEEGKIEWSVAGGCTGNGLVSVEWIKGIIKTGGILYNLLFVLEHLLYGC